MNQNHALSIFIPFAHIALFILCLHTLPAYSMGPRHRRHRSHAQIIHDISTGRVAINSGANSGSPKKPAKKVEEVTVESWNGLPGSVPRAIVFVQPVPEEQKLDSERSIAQIRQDSAIQDPAEPAAAPAPKAKKPRRRNALRKSNQVGPLGSPRFTAAANLASTSESQAAPLESENAASRTPASFFARLWFCCCASARKAQVAAQ